jgi:hypothetical protein
MYEQEAPREDGGNEGFNRSAEYDGGDEMKISITLKDPDAVYEAIQDHVRGSLKATGLTEREIDKVTDGRESELGRSLSKWVKHGEYVTVEFDTEANTATIIENQS